MNYYQNSVICEDRILTKAKQQKQKQKSTLNKINVSTLAYHKPCTNTFSLKSKLNFTNKMSGLFSSTSKKRKGDKSPTSPQSHLNNNRKSSIISMSKSFLTEEIQNVRRRSIALQSDLRKRLQILNESSDDEGELDQKAVQNILSYRYRQKLFSYRKFYVGIACFFSILGMLLAFIQAELQVREGLLYRKDISSDLGRGLGNMK